MDRSCNPARSRAPGTTLTCPATGCSGRSLALRSILALLGRTRPLFGGVAVLFVLGIQGFILALVGEYLGRIQRDVEGRPLYTIDEELG